MISDASCGPSAHLQIVSEEDPASPHVHNDEPLVCQIGWGRLTRADCPRLEVGEEPETVLGGADCVRLLRL